MTYNNNEFSPEEILSPREINRQQQRHKKTHPPKMVVNGYGLIKQQMALKNKHTTKLAKKHQA